MPTYTHRTAYSNHPARRSDYVGWWLVLMHGAEHARHETEYTFVPLAPDDYVKE